MSSYALLLSLQNALFGGVRGDFQNFHEMLKCWGLLYMYIAKGELCAIDRPETPVNVIRSMNIWMCL